MSQQPEIIEAIHEVAKVNLHPAFGLGYDPALAEMPRHSTTEFNAKQMSFNFLTKISSKTASSHVILPALIFGAPILSRI